MALPESCGLLGPGTGRPPLRLERCDLPLPAGLFEAIPRPLFVVF